MQDTVHLSHKHGVQMIAHRGLSGLEPENTVAAFAMAAGRSYFGIETDIHRTADGQFILIHDDSTGRVAAENLPVEGTDFATLRALKLVERNGEIRCLSAIRQNGSIGTKESYGKGGYSPYLRQHSSTGISGWSYFYLL